MVAQVSNDISFRSLPSNLLIVISGPGGTGKTTLIRKWRAAFPELGYVPNVTTRQPRPRSAVDETGIYEFVSRERFREMVEAGAFVQWVNPDEGKYYGTPIAPIHAAIERGEDLVFDYTPQLYLNMRRAFLERTVGIFIVPPSMGHLRERLDRQGTEVGQDLDTKIRMGLQDLGFIDEHDYYVVHDDVDETLEVVQAIRVAEKHRLARHLAIINKVQSAVPRSMQFYYDPLDRRAAAIATAPPTEPP